jgi:hypothetical protein
MVVNHPRVIRRPKFCCRCGNGGAKIPHGLGLLEKETSLNRIVGPTNQNVWVPPDVGPTQIYHESTWAPHVGPT